MKSLGLTFCLIVTLGSLGSLAWAAPAPVESKLSSATVYVDRAVLTRVGSAQVPAGESEWVFERLPASLADASLQVAARGTASAVILDVTARQTFIEASPQPRVKALEDELVGLQRQDADLKTRLAMLDQQRTLLGRIESAVTSPPPREATGPRPSFEDWQKLLSFQAENLTRLAAEQQDLTRRREELSAKLGATEAQLNLLRNRSAGGRSYKAVTVRVAAANAGSLEMSLSYAVPGASWSPAYDARLRTDSRTVELSYFGVVRNATGEDWNSLSLTLSTARPSQGGSAPQLPPWIVDVKQPLIVQMPFARPQSQLFREKSETGFGSAAPAASADALAMPIVESTTAEAAVETAATSATFKISAAVTLASDNTTQRVPITSMKLPATLRYDSTPKLLEAAFLNASVANASEFPLLAGPVNTFLDATFVATTRLKTIMPGEKFDLSLGSDDGISIKRVLVNRFAEDTGFTAKGRRVTYSFLITLTNNKKSAERVVFKEAVPISRNEKIVVKLLTPAERDIGAADAQKEITREADGILVWRVDLKPGEKRVISVKLSVDYPADLSVIGLD